MRKIYEYIKVPVPDSENWLEVKIYHPIIPTIVLLTLTFIYLKIEVTMWRESGGGFGWIFSSAFLSLMYVLFVCLILNGRSVKKMTLNGKLSVVRGELILVRKQGGGVKELSFYYFLVKSKNENGGFDYKDYSVELSDYNECLRLGGYRSYLVEMVFLEPKRSNKSAPTHALKTFFLGPGKDSLQIMGSFEARSWDREKWEASHRRLNASILAREQAEHKQERLRIEMARQKRKQRKKSAKMTRKK